MFDSTKADLKDLLKDVHSGKLQLPDFQRDYVWGDEDVRSLIASVAKGFPVGALLTLQAGGPVEFKSRVLTGVKADDASAEELLLDGQQRMTSLYQSMFCDAPMRTITDKKKEIQRFYYFDMERAARDSANIEDAIIGVPADRILKTNFGRDIVLDLSTPEAEYEHDHFPLNQVFRSSNWRFQWRTYWRERRPDRMELEERFFQGLVEDIQRYKMPIIRLDKNNSREAICLVFEKVNVGGKKLDPFELLTAIFAAHRFDLREDWNGPPNRPSEGRSKRMLGRDNARRVLKKIQSTDFLQACTLLHTRERRAEKAALGLKGPELPQISCKREALLSLPLSGYLKFADQVEEGFVKAAMLLSEQKIIAPRDLPYPPQLIELASVITVLGARAQNAIAREKLARWLWCVSLGELYGSSTESRLARDLTELEDWILNGGPAPRSVEEAIFQQDRLLSLRSRLSAAYKAVHALLMRRGCLDFVSGEGFELMSFFDTKVDVHHIFPKSWCTKAGIDKTIFDSIVNKTPLSKRTNIVIGGHAPSVYLRRIEEKEGISPDRLDDILRTHLIEPRFIRADDFDGFFSARLEALSKLIEEAMGKTVVRSHGSDEDEIELDQDEEVELTGEFD